MSREEERQLLAIMPGEGGYDNSEYEAEMQVSGVPSVQSLKLEGASGRECEVKRVMCRRPAHGFWSCSRIGGGFGRSWTVRRRPAVRVQTVRYNTKVREGRGFTFTELKVAEFKGMRPFLSALSSTTGEGSSTRRD